MIPRGGILDCCCVLLGANAGTLLRNKIPTKLQEPLMVIFGMCAIAIGMVSVVKLESLPAVLLTFILGLNIAKIKEVRAANLLPALAVVFPATAFFHLLGA